MFQNVTISDGGSHTVIKSKVLKNMAKRKKRISHGQSNSKSRMTPDTSWLPVTRPMRAR